LEQLAKIKEELHLPILTDIHSIEEVEEVAKVADVLQIPAFLCRQTFLIEAAAKTGRVVNIKKGQFMAPWDMQYAVDKVLSQGNDQILLTERGAMFGYNNLVFDVRSLPIMAQYNCLVVFDGTHSAQLPGAGKGETSGQREMIPYLVKAAVATGCHGLFLEVHPHPEESPSDKANIYPLDQLSDLLKTALKIYKAVH
jgi:2-dehydro-3-deoxyphosphooctonate aldolase (KDO 8-P synthase)